MISKPQYPYQRIMALDAFRGLTIIGMILVNSQGENPYSWLSHAAWEGCTLADVVFPFFLFIVGFSAALSLSRPTAVNPTLSILKRTVLLFALGLLINAFPSFNWEHLRFMGILQRIALCYCLGSFLYLHTNWKVLLTIFLILVLGYWVLMAYIPLPNSAVTAVSSQNNWAFFIDNQLFPLNHLYHQSLDPEGLLTTVPSLATTLLGFLAADLMRRKPTSRPRNLFAGLSAGSITFMLALGLVLMIVGYLWSYSLPWNKNLWSSSFVLWTGGLAFVTLAILYLLVDILGYTKLVFPLTIVGMNALFAFVFHVLILKILGKIFVTLANGQKVNLLMYLPQYLFPSLSSENANLAYSLCFLLFNLVVLYILYRKKIFIRL